MESEDNVGLSDIIDVLFPPIPEQNDALTMGMPSPQHAETYAPPQQSPSRIPQDLASPSTSSSTGAISRKPKPYIKILEQPAPKALRFRYKCEGRSAGSIPGVNSTPENKTYPSIEIVGYKGEVVIVVSCVTTKAPYRPHPHNIVGKDEKSCNNGICTLTINGDPLQAVFSNLGIQCVKKKDIKAALDIRENLKVDPFKTKFSHKDQPSSIDLNAVRLCFQAFQRTPEGPKILAKPVVTEPIYDKKGIYELTICRLCSCSAKVGGGDEIILLCEKFAKDDIKIRFFELSAEGKLIWEAFAEFQQTDIHKQNAIAFKTPRYHNVEITEKAKVFIQLVRPSDQETSEPLPFEYYPDTDHFKRKRLKTAGNPMAILKRELLKQENQQSSQTSNDFRDGSSTFTGANSWNPFPMGVLETEATSSHLTSYRNTLPVASPSPQPPSPCNRLDTPSPGLTKALSAESQQKMCDVFEFGAAMQDPQRQAAGQEQIQQQQQQQQQQYPNTNPFRRNSDNNFNQSLPRQQLNGINDQLINHQLLAPRISGGSITPIWNTETIIVRNNTPELHQMNIVTTIQQQQMPQQQQQQQIPQQQQQMRQHLQQMTQQQMQQQQQQLEMQQVQMQIQQQQVQLQQQQQEQQQYQQQFTQIHQQHQMQMHDIETILNAATTEECPTLSGLMQYVDSDQLMNLNTEDLPISNLSIST